MATVRPGDVSRFVESGARTASIVLVFGPDEGLVRARVRGICKAVLGAGYDQMQLVEFDADELNADPARLLDEANAISMFGGRRAIVVRHAGKLSKAAWQPLLEVPPIDSAIILQADDLAKTSPLRGAIETSNGFHAIACYPPSAADLQAVIDDKLRRAGLSITPVARAALAGLLGSDFALSEGEIDKLILYAQGQISVDIADIEACLVDSSEAVGTSPIDCAFEGRLEEIDGEVIRSFREGINPSGLLALALNHAFQLKRLAQAAQTGGLDAAMRAERIFFRRQDRVRAQASRWAPPMLSRVIDTLAAAQEASRRNAAIEETIVVRTLWSVAMASRRR